NAGGGQVVRAALGVEQLRLDSGLDVVVGVLDALIDQCGDDPGPLTRVDLAIITVVPLGSCQDSEYCVEQCLVSAVVSEGLPPLTVEVVDADPLPAFEVLAHGITDVQGRRFNIPEEQNAMHRGELLLALLGVVEVLRWVRSLRRELPFL